ncbi:MAG: hypothetical protein KF718_05670 [Polyangiaceae bacterium]|nr:hypothetical protein [Polyangiaceae bacterium]
MRYVTRTLGSWTRFFAAAAAAVACGGVTDIDFQGYPEADSGAGAGAGGSGGSAAGPAGGTGGVGGSTGGVGGNTGGSGNVAGGTGGAAVVCGGQQCETPSLPIGQIDSCCVGDKCGVSSSLLGNQCIEQNQAGTPDSSCPPQTIQGFTLQGCCKPSGMCGVLDTFIGLGCVDPSQFGGPPSVPCGGAGTGGTAGTGGAGTGGRPAPAARVRHRRGTGGAGTGGSAGGPGTSCGTTNPAVCAAGAEKCCVLNPGADYCTATATACSCAGAPNCTTLPVTCDGPEDCPGQICCATFSFPQNRYVSVQCENTCTGQTKREVCHPGQVCLNPNHTCSASSGLPSNLNRCN